MSRSILALGALLVCLVLGACGGGDDETKRTETSRKCEDICNFWAHCNNADLEDGVCADHCDQQTSEVSSDCADLYAEQTNCEADNLDCSDLLGTACEAEYTAYYDCESAR